MRRNIKNGLLKFGNIYNLGEGVKEIDGLMFLFECFNDSGNGFFF